MDRTEFNQAANTLILQREFISIGAQRSQVQGHPRMPAGLQLRKRSGNQCRNCVFPSMSVATREDFKSSTRLQVVLHPTAPSKEFFMRRHSRNLP